MNSVALALLTFGVCLAVILVAVLAGEVIYHLVYPHLFNKPFSINKPFSKGSKMGDKEYPQEEGALYVRSLRDYWPP
jgi:hypothetical protein